MKIPSSVPTPGFYYHYKHDPSGPIENYAYEVIAVGFDTERKGAFYVNYRPLYDSSIAYQASQKLGVPCLWNRPLEMFMEDVVKDGTTMPRFTKIEASEKLEELRTVRDLMYDTGKEGA